MNILDKIVKTKRAEVAQQKKALEISNLERIINEKAEPSRNFMRHIKNAVLSHRLAIIAELKKASPSKGIIREDFDPVEIARDYALNGATCLSVLTDSHYFQGSPSYIRQVKQAVSLPLLRKDFIIDEYQILESKALGADCILLIAAILDDSQLLDYTLMAHDLGMDVLVEVHSLEEFGRALNLPIRVIGVNNRNLKDFSISMDVTLQIRQELPDDYILISESGIESHEDIQHMQNEGIFAFLVGTTLMSSRSAGEALARLRGG